MPHFRAYIRWAYAAALVAGALVALALILDGYQVYFASVAEHGSDWIRFDRWRVMQKGGTGVVLLAQTLAFSALFFRRSVDWASIPAYVTSYFAFGVASWLSLMVAGKDFDTIGLPAQLARLAVPFVILTLVSTAALVLIALTPATQTPRTDSARAEDPGRQ